jgi:hypothetical protein
MGPHERKNKGRKLAALSCFAPDSFEHEHEPFVADLGVSSVERYAAL